MKTKRNILFFGVLTILTLLCILLSIFFLGKPLTKKAKQDSEKTYYILDLTDELLIDGDYKKEKAKTQSNIELGDLNRKYADIWNQKIELYYQKISDHYTFQNNTAMLENTKAMKDEWNRYYDSQIDYYEKSMLSSYGSGSIVPIKISYYDLSLKRNKAIEMYNLCLNLGIEVEILPRKTGDEGT